MATPQGHLSFLVDEGNREASPESTVVLLHGFPESSFSYAGAVALLRERFDRVLAFDFIGFGFSDKPSAGFSYSLFEQTDVAFRLLKDSGVRGCHFIAHDMGDSVMTEILARDNQNRPDWFTHGIQSVTFTNGSMVMRDAKLRLGQRALVSPVGPLLARANNSRRIFEKQVISAHGNDCLTPAQINDMFSAVTTDAPSGLMGHLIGYIKERRRFESSRWLPALRDCEAPVQICWGGDDAVAPVAIAESLKREVKPDAHLVVINGLGHFAQIQDPELWFSSLASFWDQ